MATEAVCRARGGEVCELAGQKVSRGGVTAAGCDRVRTARRHPEAPRAHLV